MTFQVLAENIVQVQQNDKTPIISDMQSALDLFVSAEYTYGCKYLVIAREAIADNFFDLKTGVAGEIVQKVVNYGFRMAIVGDFSKYTSKSLQDFIYESNKGRVLCFVDSIESAIAKLS